MRDRYLEVTYRKGKPMAAYLHLPHPAGTKSARTEKRTEGLLVDFASDGTPLGLEITAPSSVTTAEVNSVLSSLGLDALDDRDLAPLAA
jgi:hypothetical protein